MNKSFKTTQRMRHANIALHLQRENRNLCIWIYGPNLTAFFKLHRLCSCKRNIFKSFRALQFKTSTLHGGRTIFCQLRCGRWCSSWLSLVRCPCKAACAGPEQEVTGGCALGCGRQHLDAQTPVFTHMLSPSRSCWQISRPHTGLLRNIWIQIFSS